jgi:hypothetical protein
VALFDSVEARLVLVDDETSRRRHGGSPLEERLECLHPGTREPKAEGAKKVGGSILPLFSHPDVATDSLQMTDPGNEG